MSTTLIQSTVQSGVATVRLNRPDKRNALNDELRHALVETLERFAADASVRALVLTGNGKSFCAGGDVEAMAQRLEVPHGEVGFNGWLRQQQVHHAQMLLHNFPVPTIAAVNGSTAGLGADTALACDFVLAANDASFAWSYVHRGLVADGGGMYFLPRRVGLPKAKELIFSGRRIDANNALRLGIADRLAAPEELVATAESWAAEFAKGSRTALALGKSILNQSLELSAEDVFARGSAAQGICYASTEHRKSVSEFLQANPAKKAPAGP